MVDDLVSTMAAVVRQGGNSLSVVVSEDVGQMRADLTKTRQILFNLLSNAGKFTTSGTISLHVARRATADGDQIEFAVTDTGIGLSPQQQAKLFRPFAQGDSSISRKYGGTGLGLFLVARFCKLMNGDVSVVSAEGQGARFTVRIPAEVRALESSPQRETRASELELTA
jgi:signal transduction histidine kinase